MRDTVWQNFSEINDGEGIKMKCNECQQIVAKHKTSISSHWSYKHNDKMQPPRKISASSLDVSAEPTDRYKKIHAALSAVLSIPSMPIIIILHPLMRRLFHVMSPNFEVIRKQHGSKQYWFFVDVDPENFDDGKEEEEIFEDESQIDNQDEPEEVDIWLQ
uniref:BED-type domain-containing protein n=1 Tax=Ditylenchus dipsaci TaxID=166011 RepID=A0A915EAU5_9BILA